MDLKKGCTSAKFSFESKSFTLTVMRLMQNAYGEWVEKDRFPETHQITLKIEFDISPYFRIDGKPKIAISLCEIIDR